MISLGLGWYFGRRMSLKSELPLLLVPFTSCDFKATFIYDYWMAFHGTPLRWQALAWILEYKWPCGLFWRKDKPLNQVPWLAVISVAKARQFSINREWHQNKSCSRWTFVWSVSSIKQEVEHYRIIWTSKGHFNIFAINTVADGCKSLGKVLVLLCVWMCDCVCACMWVGVCAHVYLCLWRPEADVRYLLLSSFPGIFLPPPKLGLQLCIVMPIVLCRYWGLNSSLHTYVASILLNEPPP